MNLKEQVLMLLRFFLLVVVGFFAGSVSADIYKCADKNGRVFYQNEECGDGATKLGKIRAAGSGSGQQQNGNKSDAANESILNKNLLSNSGFENHLIKWKFKTDVTWRAGIGTNGSAALQLHARKPPDDKYIHETVVSQCVPIGNGVKFKLGGSFMYEGHPLKNHANRLRVYWYESLDCMKGGQFGHYVQPKSVPGWQHLSRDGLTPALLAKAAKIEIKQNGRYTNNGKAYWDDIYLVATEISNATPRKPGYRLPIGFDFIENGHFSQNISGWRTGWKSEWVSYAGHKNLGAIKVTAWSTKSSIGRGAFNQCVNFGAGGTFNLGASFKRDTTSTQKGNARLRVTWYEQSDCHGRAKTTPRHVDPDESYGWQSLQVKNLKAAPGSVSVRIELIQTVSGPGEHIAYWDDIYFKTVTGNDASPE